MNKTQTYWQIIFQYLLDTELTIFHISEIQKIEELEHLNIYDSLELMVKSGFLKRLEKGKYCLFTFHNELAIGNYLIEDGTIAYWSALNFHGLTEQFPHTVFVETTHQKRNKKVFGVQYQFVKIKEEKRIGVIEDWYNDYPIRITDIEKTIVDCFDLPKYSGGFPELLRAFEEAELEESKLIAYCKAVQNISAIKRMGYLAELLQKEGLQKFIQYAKNEVNSSPTPFDPFGVKKGSMQKKWRLVMNIEEKDILEIIGKIY
ncbi:MAG: type IV toxin-antitoxin system AbiEi family antitoxin domain-containing protein [Chitinophagales bacterium]